MGQLACTDTGHIPPHLLDDIDQKFAYGELLILFNVKDQRSLETQ